MNAMTVINPSLPLRALGLALALAIGSAPAFAQVDHSMHMPPPKPAVKKPAIKEPVAKRPITKAAAKPVARPVVQKTPAKEPGTSKPAGESRSRTPAVDPHAGHAMPAPAAKTPARSPAARAVDPHAGHAMPAPQPAKQPVRSPSPRAVDPHAGHAMPAPATVTATEPMDHAAMGHDMPMPAQSKPAAGDPAQAIDHTAMGHDMPLPGPSDPATDESAQAIDHAAMGHSMPTAPTEPVTPIPVVTAQDRIAAFPDVAGHAVHDNARHSYWLLDRLEVWDAKPGTGVEWEAQSWIGTDLDRLWLRSEGERVRDTTESADIEVLYGRSVAPWWDVVAGVRHDFGHGPSQTFAAFGVMGLAPYKYEVEATAYVGQSGQTAARVELEYDTLLTNRLILQSQVEAEFYGRDDPRRGIGSGLSTVGAGLRLRYEFTRKFAPYIGVVHERAFGGTADLRRDDDEDNSDTRIVAGLRLWF